MALIKKYNAGGKADFRNYVVSKLLSDESLSASEQELISKGLSSFEPSKEINEDTGNFSGRVKDEATTFAWLNQANKEFIKNTPEQIQLMPEGGWGPEHRSPEGFNKYLQKNLYGDNEHSFVRAIGDMTDNDKIKQFVVKNAKDYTNSYLSDAAREAEHRPENEWAKKDEMQQAQNVLSGIDENKTISETDWNAVVDSLRKLGDDPVEFLRDSRQLEAIEKNRIAKEQRDKLEESRTALKNLGVDDDLLEQIQGFSIDNDYEPFEDLPFLKKTLEEGNYTLIQSPDKSVQALLKNGKLVKNVGGLVTDDQLSPHFGKTWGTAENGEFLIFDKENIDANEFFDWETVGPDEFETRNVGREILTTDPKFAGYKIVGYSGDDQKGFKDTDIFGRRQFTKEFTFTKDGKTFKVIRGDDGIYRKEGEKKRFTMPTTMSFGEDIEEVAKDYKKTYFRNQGSPLYMLDVKPISTTSKRMGIKGIPTREEIFADAETTIEQFEKAYEKAIKDKKDVAIKQADNKRLAEFLTHVLTDPKYSEEDREWAEKLVHRQTALALKKIYDKKTNQEIPLFDTPLFMWKKGGIIEPATKFDPEKFRKWKEGGVLKAEKGSSLTDFYKASSELSKSRPAAAESSAETGDGTVSSGYHDPTGTVADSNFLDWVSLGGTALAFVPGVGGVVGGLISTAADAANAAFRGEWTRDDSKKLLSNIGFTALSAIGLGAAKGIGMAGKSAKAGKGLWGAGKVGKAVGSVKTMGTAEKVARVAKTASARAKVMGPSGKSIVKAADRLENLTKAANKTGKGSSLISKVLKGDKKALTDIANSGYKSVEAVLKDYKVVNNLGSVKTTWYGQAGQGVVKGVKNLANLDLTKVGKGIGYGMSTAQIAGGVGSGITIAGNVRDEGHLWKGIKKSKMSDVERVAQSAVLGYGWRQNVLNRRAVDKHTIKKYAEEPSVTLSVTDKNGNLVKNIPLKNDATVKNKEMGKSWWGKKFSSQGEKEIAAIEKDLVDLVGKDDLELIKKTVTDGGVINPIIKAGVPTRRILMDTKVDMSSPEDVRSFLRAERVLTRGQGNFFKRATPQEIYRQSDNTRTLSPRIRNIMKTRQNKPLKPKKPEVWTQGSLFKKGGILSFRTGGPAYMDTASSWEPPAYMNTMFPWERDAYLNMPHLWEQTPYGTQPPTRASTTDPDFKRYLPDMKTATVVEGARPTIPTLEQYENSNPAPDSNPNPYPEDPGLLVDVLGVDPFDRNKIRPKNWGPAFELGRFLTSEWHNKLSTRKRIRGLADSIPTLSGVSSPHLRTGSPLTMEAHRQVGNLQSGARRAGKTVNVNDYMNAMLTSQKNAADLMMKAASEDANINRGIKEQQMSLDRDTIGKNITLGNQRSEIAGKIALAMANEEANLTRKSGENRSALLAGFKKEVADKDRRKLFNDYVVGIQNPNIAKAQEWYRNKTSDEVIANLEKEYLKIEEEKKKYNPRHEIIPYKQSKQYADYIAHINTQMKPISQELARLNQLGSVLSIYSPATKTT